MNTVLQDTLFRNATRAGVIAAALIMSAVRFLRRTLLYTALTMVAAIAWVGIVQPRWLVDDGYQNCTSPATQASAITSGGAAPNAGETQPMKAWDASTLSAQEDTYHQCLAHDRALTDRAPLTRADYERLLARADATEAQNLRIYMVLALLLGATAAALESALRDSMDRGFSVRTDRRRSGTRVIDDLSYPSVYRSNRS